MGSYSFPTEETLALSMAHWYQTLQMPTQTVLFGGSNPLSVLFWLQVANLPEPQNAGGRMQIRSEKTNETTPEKKAEVCRWKAVTANVLTFQPAEEKHAAGFFASGRRLEFEKRIIQEGRQRSSATRQVGRYFVVSAAADRGNCGPEAWIHRAHVSKPNPPITLLPDSRRLVVRLSEIDCQLDLIVLHAPPAGQTSETKNQASLWWEHTLQQLLALDLLPFSILCVHANGKVGSNTCRQIGNAQTQVEDVNGAGLRLLLKTLHMSLPQTKSQQQNDWTWKSRQGTKRRIDFWGIAEAVQLQVHSCVPTNALLFGSGHFQDHREVVLEFSTVVSTSLRVTHDYRPAPCAGVSPMLAPAMVAGNTLATDALPRTKVRHFWPNGLIGATPHSKQKPRQPWMDRSSLGKVMVESAWRRQWFRLLHATLSLKKTFWFRGWQTGVAPLQVAVAHDTLLVHACTVSVLVTQSSKRVRLLVKQAAAENGNSNRSTSSFKTPKLVPKLIRSCCDYPARGGLCVAASLCKGFRPPYQNGPL